MYFNLINFFFLQVKSVLYKDKNTSQEDMPTIHIVGTYMYKQNCSCSLNCIWENAQQILIYYTHNGFI